MSDKVKLSSKLPGDFETNGVDQLAADLCENPAEVRIGVIWFDVGRQIIDTDSGEHVPVLRVRRFEPLGAADEVSQAIRDAAAQAFSDRTGREPIPFDVIEITEERFSDTLPEGEE